MDIIQGTILPALRAQFTLALGNDHWTLEADATESQTLKISYPPALKLNELAGMQYLRPVECASSLDVEGKYGRQNNARFILTWRTTSPALFKDPSFTVPVLARPERSGKKPHSCMPQLTVTSQQSDSQGTTTIFRVCTTLKEARSLNPLAFLPRWYAIKKCSFAQHLPATIGPFQAHCG